MFNGIIKTILCSSTIAFFMPLCGAMQQQDANPIQHQAEIGLGVLADGLEQIQTEIHYNAFVAIIKNTDDIEALECLKQALVLFKTISNQAPPEIAHQATIENLNNGLFHIAATLQEVAHPTNGNLTEALQSIFSEIDAQELSAAYITMLKEISWTAHKLILHTDERLNTLRHLAYQDCSQNLKRRRIYAPEPHS